jgi:hypothetical protein
MNELVGNNLPCRFNRLVALKGQTGRAVLHVQLNTLTPRQRTFPIEAAFAAS